MRFADVACGWQDLRFFLLPFLFKKDVPLRDLFRCHGVAQLHAFHEPGNAGIDEPIEDVFAALFVFDDPDALENVEMLADGGEVDPDRVDDVADAAFPFVETADDPKSDGMSERLEDSGDFHESLLVVLHRMIPFVIL